jgi:Peptidase family M41
MHNKAMRATAYHEAGHAVISLIERHHFQRVSIIPNKKDGTLGHCTSNPSPKWLTPEVANTLRERKWIESEIMILLAGSAAERHMMGRHSRKGSGGDREDAIDLAQKLYDGRVLERFLDFMVELTRDAVANPVTWLKIEAVAHALLDRGTLSGKEVRAVCREALICAMADRDIPSPVPTVEGPPRPTRPARRA